MGMDDSQMLVMEDFIVAASRVACGSQRLALLTAALDAFSQHTTRTRRHQTPISAKISFVSAHGRPLSLLGRCMLPLPSRMSLFWTRSVAVIIGLMNKYGVEDDMEGDTDGVRPALLDNI